MKDTSTATAAASKLISQIFCFSVTTLLMMKWLAVRKRTSSTLSSASFLTALLNILFSTNGTFTERVSSNFDTQTIVCYAETNFIVIYANFSHAQTLDTFVSFGRRLAKGIWYASNYMGVFSPPEANSPYRLWRKRCIRCRYGVYIYIYTWKLNLTSIMMAVCSFY